jgi:nucleoside-diphosphate-sugar epimerase
MMRRVPSLDRIHQAVGFQPQYTLDQTLGLIIDELKS